MKSKLLLFILLVSVLAENGLSQVTTVNFKVEDLPNGSMGIVGIRGSATPLSWEKTIFLKNSKVSVDFASPVQTLEYKYVLDNGTDIIWEGIANRQLNFPLSETVINDQWDKETPVDISILEDISSKQLLEDFKILEEMVLNVHPGTYRYSSKAEIDSALSELKAKFQEPLSIGEAYLAMSKVTATIQCDHTKVGFNNQNRFVNTVIHEQFDKLPFTFKWFRDRMFIDLNASQQPVLKRGAEILTINNVSVSTILSSLLPYVAADGATDKNRVGKLEVDGFDFRYNAFDVFYPLKYPSKSNKYILKVIVNGSEKEIEVDGIHREARAKILRDRYADFPYTRDDTWKFEIHDGIGILTLNSFGLMGWKAMTIDYKKFLENSFKSLKEDNIENLVIDIRRNNGGNDEIKNELFSYLEYDKTHEMQTIRDGRTRFKEFPQNLKCCIKTWGENPWFYNLNPDSEENGYFVFDDNFKRDDKMKKSKYAFNGNTFLLIGPANTSLAFYTARDFQRFGIGKLIGEETGGNQRGINGGQILFLTLPNSGIEIDFPVMGGFSKGTLPNSGIIPDYEITASIEDFLSGADPVINKAFELIK